MAERLGLSLPKYAEVASYLEGTVSLDAPMGSGGKDGGRLTLLDGLPDGREQALLAEEDTAAALRDDVDGLLGRLLPREALVVRKRFGLDGEPPCSMANVA